MTHDGFKEALERCAVEDYVKWLTQKTHHSYTIEALVTSIEPSQLSKGQSPPDALVTDNVTGEKFWIEVAHISRSQAMFKCMSEMSKFGRCKCIGNHNISTVIHLESQAQCLDAHILSLIREKSQKIYAPFAAQANAFRGILILKFVCLDPFFNSEVCYELLSRIRDEHVLLDWNIQDADFQEIIFVGYVCDGRSVEKIIEHIATPTTLQRLKDIKTRNMQVRQEIDARKTGIDYSPKT